MTAETDTEYAMTERWELFTYRELEMLLEGLRAVYPKRAYYRGFLRLIDEITKEMRARRPKEGTAMPTISLSDEELQLILDALDSHEYWQLSHPVYRDSGYVQGKGSDDPDMAEEIKRCRALADRLTISYR